MSIDEHIAPNVGAQPEATSPPPPDNRRWWVLIVVSMAQFLVVTDATIVNVMLPQLQRSLGMSGTGLQWVMSLYVLLFGGLLLLGGRLTDVVGRRRVLLSGIVLFTAGSLLAGLAHSQAQLLSARAIQGIAAACVSPAALSILVTTFTDLKERNKAFGIWGTVIGIGASIGTLLGGAIVDIGWRWAFYINVPIGVVLALGAVALIRGGAPTGPRPKSDTAGALTATAGLLAVVYGIVSTTMHGWLDPLTIGSLAAGAVLLGVFVQVEHRSTAPLLPLRLFRQRGVVAGTLGQFITAGVMLPTFFLLPQYMQTVLGYSPLKTGLAYLPTSLALMIVAPILTQAINKTGPRSLYISGAVVLGGMLVLLQGTALHGNYWGLLMPATAMLGLGLVLCMIPTPVVGTSQATEQDAGTTSALLNAATEVGGALGLAVTATVVTARAGELIVGGAGPLDALNQGLHRGFLVLLVWAGLSLLVGIIGFRGFKPTAAADAHPAVLDVAPPSDTPVPAAPVPTPVPVGAES
ncbi:MAG TPA: MFS transporter [Mycobacteriales bacterium]|nr:MFS transporter [Mycobacteriales bacterium]